MLRLTSLSFAHPTVPAEKRAELTLSQMSGASQPMFVLTTCLRVEVAWVHPEEAFSADDIGRWRADEEAFLHLCRVAAGLESPLIGEPEVLGQFRRALTHFRQSPGADPFLVRTLDAAVGVARSIRRLLGGTPRGSLAAVAAQMAADFERVAIFGSGAMARAAASSLEGKAISIFARRPVSVGGREASPWDQVQEALESFPAVISTFPGKAPIAPGLSRALMERTTPLLLIDLGMPPAFSPRNDMVRYVGIDELASGAEARPSPAVDQALTEEAGKSWHRLRTPTLTSKVIAALTAVADQAVNEEVARFAHRLRYADDPEPVLRQLAHTVARRVLHSPISYLGSTSDEAVEVLAEAFGVDRD